MEIKDENYYENLDKRTKEYKEWKAKRDAAPEGLGDTVEKVFEVTGIANVVKFIAGEDCGCAERKAKLNGIVPYRNPECFTEEEYVYLSEVFNKPIHSVNMNLQKDLLRISNRVFRRKDRLSSCGSCVRSMYNNLKKYFDAYSE